MFILTEDTSLTSELNVTHPMRHLKVEKTLVVLLVFVVYITE